MDGSTEPLHSGTGPGETHIRDPLEQPFSGPPPDRGIGQFHARKPWMEMFSDEAMIVEAEDRQIVWDPDAAALQKAVDTHRQMVVSTAQGCGRRVAGKQAI